MILNFDESKIKLIKCWYGTHTDKKASVALRRIIRASVPAFLDA